MTLDPWEKEQIKAIWQEDRRRKACFRRAERAAAALLKAYDDHGDLKNIDTLALRTVEEVAKELGYLSNQPKPRRQRITRDLTRKVWDRDGWTCQRCGSHTDLTVDRIYPVSRGGTNEFDNLQTLCRPCNSSKGAKI